MTMDEIVRRLEKAEKKIAALEETLETIKQMNISEQMQEYIESRQRTVQLTGLLNSLSGQGMVDTSEAEREIAQAQIKKNKADKLIREAIASASIIDMQYATPAELFTYERCTVGSYSGMKITGYNGFDDEVIAVPESIAGITVICIGENAFLNGTMLEVILPVTIRDIASSGFRACKKLRKINIPGSVVSIGDSAFSNCSALSEISLPEGLEKIGRYAFDNCGIESINFPGTLKAIPLRCCCGCKKLKTVTIEEGVNIIDTEAFKYAWSSRGYREANNIAKIVIPKSVKSIGENAFEDRKETLIACLGMETVGPSTTWASDTFAPGATIFVIPGSAMQKYARDHNMKIKPLTEFPVE